MSVANVTPRDQASAQALIAHLRTRARQVGVDLDSALRAPPPEPTTCCGRGCNGCVWEGYHHAVRYWADDALAVLAPPSARP
nr:oxidoreductase-like domain-containing protein [Hydrogenophaga sp.]